ncbi:DUF4371 domain-containing protein [Trichonephila clavata]|uniref:DUF4371 domain-containing protein n=1 Tax=Trichonephila clavata TaxID=2740835 RepID=A0A8X6FVN7_TRICU|nr:DUF4371 domain-containing protein [Trichonephila clavata]
MFLPIASAISLFFTRVSSHTLSCTFPMVYSLTAVWGRPSRTPSSRDMRPRLNAATKVLIIFNQLRRDFLEDIQSLDHLSEIFNKSGAGTSSSASDILHLHRTKFLALIRKVISPELLKEQVAEINESQFSLILDESTDVACCKHLCLCVHYYNRKENNIVSQFLGLLEVVESTADSLYKHVKDLGIEINLRNCFAIGIDGTSNLCRKNHSSFTLMKKDIPNLFLIKCICPSLHLVCSYAYEHLPSNLDYMIR